MIKKLNENFSFDYNNLNHDQKIFDLLNDKTVALVGPAPTLINSNFGNFIDSFDVVCRVNLGFYVPPEIRKDYGERCDLLIIELFNNEEEKKKI